MESHITEHELTSRESNITGKVSREDPQESVRSEDAQQNLNMKSKKISRPRSLKHYKQVSDEDRQEIIRRAVIEKEKLARVCITL